MEYLLVAYALLDFNIYPKAVLPEKKHPKKKQLYLIQNPVCTF